MNKHVVDSSTFSPQDVCLFISHLDIIVFTFCYYVFAVFREMFLLLCFSIVFSICFSFGEGAFKEKNLLPPPSQAHPSLAEGVSAAPGRRVGFGALGLRRGHAEGPGFEGLSDPSDPWCLVFFVVLCCPKKAIF